MKTYKKNILKSVSLFIIITSFLFSISCKKANEGFAPSVAPGESFLLAYGASSSDRNLLASRISGNDPPTFADVISRWKRFSGIDYYANPDLIVASPANCFTSMDGNGSWSNITVAPNIGASPNTHSSCNTPTMNSLSWIYLTGPNRLFNIQNTNNYNGFFSSIKFDQYIATATLSSTTTDDDGIGFTIAAYVDVSNVVHTLSAYRTHGHIGGPLQGWGIVHKSTGGPSFGATVHQIFDDKSVGGVNKNTGPLFGGTDTQGWNGRNTQIRVEREGNIVRAYTSPWNAGPTAAAIDPASVIELDLSNPALGLTGFIGPQSYGYETLSQANATFTTLTFQIPNVDADPPYLFDLRDNLVYIKNESGIGYVLLPGVQAMEMIGYPMIVTNIETQRAFSITSATAYTEIQQ